MGVADGMFWGESSLEKVVGGVGELIFEKVAGGVFWRGFCGFWSFLQ